MTLYAIFKRISQEEDTYAFVAERQARSSTAAIRAYLEDSGGNGEVYWATPRRSFRPVTVKVETKTALKFS